MLPNYDKSAAYPAAKYAIPSGVWPEGDRRPVQQWSLIAAPVHLNVQVAYLLAQRVAVEPEEVGGADLIASGRRQRCRQQRHFDFLEDAVIEAGGRHAVGETGKMRRQIGFDGAAEIVDAELNAAARRHGGRRQFAVNDRAGDHVLRIQCREPAREVLKFAEDRKSVV